MRREHEWQTSETSGGRDHTSPPQEVERAVQERAKAVDMGSPDGARRMRVLVDDEVGRWSDFKRGLRSFDIADRELVVERAFRNVAGYGPLEPLLDDDDVWEIMVG